jgi:hypothetical protein
MLFPCGCTLADEQRRRQTELAHLSNLAAFRDQTFASFDRAVPGVMDAGPAHKTCPVPGKKYFHHSQVTI